MITRPRLPSDTNLLNDSNAIMTALLVKRYELPPFRIGPSYALMIKLYLRPA